MKLRHIQAIAARAESLSDEERLAFQRELIADHEAIITLPELEARLPEMRRAAARALYRSLEAELAKYPSGIGYSPVSGAAAIARKPTADAARESLFATPWLMLRAKIEHFRDVRRDANGRIVRDDAWTAKRKAFLEMKAKQASIRNANIQKKLSDLDGEVA